MMHSDTDYCDIIVVKKNGPNKHVLMENQTKEASWALSIQMIFFFLQFKKKSFLVLFVKK